ncbi:cyclic nucleotide gated cation channel [Trichuris trichiura]|uniref:Cyclic nucleotide gated cation channel n=1 Tax=Trichuris trichiura TaxID=36087 RepID=A0A077ZC75_TRITR|nr:cyclic nucleotide gated cation channel [Trichuris trichiura]
MIPSQSFDRLANWRSNKVLSSKSEKDDEFIKKFAVGCAAAAYADEVKRSGFLGWLQSKVVVPYGNAYYYWTAIVSVTVTYNVITVVLRSVFNEYQESYITAWLAIDYLCDMVYIFDIIVKFRTGESPMFPRSIHLNRLACCACVRIRHQRHFATVLRAIVIHNSGLGLPDEQTNGYLEQGLIVRDLRKLAINYMKSTRFKLDSISILPTDVFYVFTGLANPTARLNRLFKFPIVLEFAERTESRTSWPNAFRLFTLISCILVIIHLNACLYFAVSEAIGLGSDQWVYDNNTLTDSFSRRYFYSFYWSTLTLTTIGETPYPERDEEILFNTVDYLIGVLIFATLVGNIGSMITNMNAARTEFQSRMDSIKQFMESHKVDRDLQKRVITWFDYQWSRKINLGSDSALKTLPPKLRAEIAIHVHFSTLRKVTIFQDCEAGLLVELVLALQLQVFSPGDYICKKGDVGKEMYIVKEGKLNVVSDDGSKVFATLSEGAVFGELSILNIAGNKNGNRRTANIRSVGYSNLFALSKDDLWSVLRYYPEARKMLIMKGKEILRKDNLLDENVQEEEDIMDNLSRYFTDQIEDVKRRYELIVDQYEKEQQTLQDRIAALETKLKNAHVETNV